MDTANLTQIEAQVLKALLEEVESSWEEGADEWGIMYLDNVDHRLNNQRAFAGVLSSLTQKGLYRPVESDAFGAVKMNQNQ